MTINAPAAIMMAFHVVAAEEAGVPRASLGGTIQADILKEYIAQKSGASRSTPRCASGDANLMPALLDAARAPAGEGEIVEALQAVWGTYTETPVF
jgi:methylmalonyl-CoA mutase N-terminal domain/subunit